MENKITLDQFRDLTKNSLKGNPTKQHIKMIHNEHNLQVGQIVMLDKEYQNKSIVGIFAFTPNKMYATVYAKNETGDMWQVMTNRLTPIDQSK